MNKILTNKTIDAGSPKNHDLKIKATGQSVSLTTNDFKAAGGEGTIYVKGGRAYKIYNDPSKMIPEKKILELSKLTEPYIIRPQNVLVDKYGQPVGYDMTYKPDTFALCQLFPKAFRDRHKITPEQIVALIKKLQHGVKHVHSHGILLVDLNELNFIVDKHFNEVFFLDVDSYQTPSYPATAIMESIRDYNTKGFTQNTDWYAWGIVTFQMLIGIHPYKGKHPTLKGDGAMTSLEQRMRKGVSVFNDDVTVPATCMPFDIIPSALRDWYTAVFEHGDRSAPPDKYESKIISTARVQRQAGSNNYVIGLMYTFTKDITHYHNGYIITTNGLYKDSRILLGLKAVVEVAVTPDTLTPVVARLEQNKLKMCNALTKMEVPCNIQGDDMMSYAGRLYIKNGNSVFEIQFMELGQNLVVTPKKVGNVVENSTTMYEGVVVSTILNKHHFYVFPKKDTCHQLQVAEFDGFQVIDAKFDKGVLMIVGQKAGRYDKYIIRFSDDYKSYDIRIQSDISTYDVNFVTLEKGVVLHMNHEGVLEAFKARMGAKEITEIDDPAVDTDCNLFAHGDQAMFARGEKLYKFRMQPNVGTAKAPKPIGAVKGGKPKRDKNTGELILDVDGLKKQLAAKDPAFAKAYNLRSGLSNDDDDNDPNDKYASDPFNKYTNYRAASLTRKKY